MSDILRRIVEHKKKEVARQIQLLPLSELQANSGQHQPQSLAARFSRQRPAIIAEFKRKSPSKGIINDKAQPASTAVDYTQADAAGISVLTDNHFFGGSQTDLKAIRQVTSLPLLRKDFIIDQYQIYESKAMGADVILLITSILSKDEIEHFTSVAHELGLECLLELHASDDLEKVCPDVDLIGVNNRNLKSFTVNTNHSKKMLKHLPERIPCIAESGLADADTVIDLFRAGFSGFLMGEYFMKQAKPGQALMQLQQELDTRV